MAVWGFAAGPEDGTHIIAEATNGFRIRNGTTVLFHADTSGDLFLLGSLTVGTAGHIASGATGFATATGFWLDYNAGTPRFRVGTTAGNRLSWNGTDLEVRAETVSLDANGITIDGASAINFTHGYKFSTTFTGGTLPESYGLFNVEVSTHNRSLYVLNSTDIASGQTCLTGIHAGSGSYGAHVYVIADGTAATLVELSGATITASGHVTQNSGAYLYPGTASGLSSYQTSFFLASHASYGLFTNTGLGVTSDLYANNFIFFNDTDTHIVNDAANSMKFSTGGTARVQISTSAGGMIPYTDNTQTCGLSSFAWTNVYAYAFPAPSSASLKSDIVDSPLGIDFLMQLRPRAFKYLSDIARSGDNAPVRHGFVVDEVAQITTSKDFGGIVLSKTGAPEGFDRGELIAPIINAIQDQERRLRALKADLVALGGQ